MILGTILVFIAGMFVGAAIVVKLLLDEVDY